MSIEQFVTRDGKRIATEVINAPARRRKIKTFKVAFVKFPLFWIEALNCTKNVNARDFGSKRPVRMRCR